MTLDNQLKKAGIVQANSEFEWLNSSKGETIYYKNGGLQVRKLRAKRKKTLVKTETFRSVFQAKTFMLENLVND